MTNEIFIVNKKDKSLNNISSVLNDCHMLLDFSVSERGSRVAMNIVTDSANVEYVVSSKKEMTNFLIELKERVKYNKEDIESVLEEIEDLEFAV
ncbi:hypothetical protein [Bacillus velezensis]|uniref:hypothetical protein n=1 Tax=Bacillus velezensis TaxID=492670 RepID=UPI002FBE4491